jgi:glycosyltransferase involved in cell wall biosynthesis
MGSEQCFSHQPSPYYHDLETPIPRATMGDTRHTRVLVLVSTEYAPPYLEEVRQEQESGGHPRLWSFEVPMDLYYLDQRFLGGPSTWSKVPVAPRWRQVLLRPLPIQLAQAIEAFMTRRHYDVILSSGAEKAGLSFCALQTVFRTNTPFVGLMGWVSPKKKAEILKRVHKKISVLVTPPSNQVEIAVRDLGVPAGKVVSVPWGTDQKFWSPVPDTPTTMICSAGREMRDYTTLIEAVGPTGIPCHIATVMLPGRQDAWTRELAAHGELPPNVTIGPLSFTELRDLYARSRFVVLPLRPSDTDNGVSCMLEAMAMGRAVLCSKIEGQRDVLEDGRNGRFVPPRDVVALRRAIVEMWENPEETARMGEQGRQDVEARFTVEQFAQGITKALETAVQNRGRRS